MEIGSMNINTIYWWIVSEKIIEINHENFLLENAYQFIASIQLYLISSHIVNIC